MPFSLEIFRRCGRVFAEDMRAAERHVMTLSPCDWNVGYGHAGQLGGGANDPSVESHRRDLFDGDPYIESAYGAGTHSCSETGRTAKWSGRCHRGDRQNSPRISAPPLVTVRVSKS